MENFPCKDETYRILGACFEVYKEKGCGFLEPVYQDCMEIELDLQQILFVPKQPILLEYKGRPIRHTYEPDLICFAKVVVELKAVSALADEHRAQLLNYLNATGLDVGLLINFGHYPGLEYERLVNTRKKGTHNKSIYTADASKDLSNPNGHGTHKRISGDSFGAD